MNEETSIEQELESVRQFVEEIRDNNKEAQIRTIYAMIEFIDHSRHLRAPLRRIERPIEQELERVNSGQRVSTLRFISNSYNNDPERHIDDISTVYSQDALYVGSNKLLNTLREKTLGGITMCFLSVDTRRKDYSLMLRPNTKKTDVVIDNHWQEKTTVNLWRNTTKKDNSTTEQKTKWGILYEMTQRGERKTRENSLTQREYNDLRDFFHGKKNPLHHLIRDRIIFKNMKRNSRQLELTPHTVVKILTPEEMNKEE